MNGNYSPVWLIYSADIGFLHGTANKYKRDALKIKNNDFGECSPSFHLLSTLAFELLPKVLICYEICLKYKNDKTISEESIKEEMITEMKVLIII